MAVDDAVKLEQYEVVNLPQDMGDDPPPAIAYLIVNGVSYETDVEVLGRLGTEIRAARKRAKDGLSGRVGSNLTVRDVTVSVGKPQPQQKKFV